MYGRYLRDIEVDDVEACVRSLLVAAAYGPGRARVVVLDDGSTDGTTEVLERLVATTDREALEVVPGSPTPPGWLGKPA